MNSASAPRSRAAGKRLDAWLRRSIPLIRIPLAATIAIGAAGGLLMVAQAWFLARVVNAVAIERHGLHHITPLLFALVGIFAARALTTAAGEIVAFEAAARVKTAIRHRLQAHITALGAAFTRGERSGALATTLIDGVEALDKYYAGYLPQMALSAFLPLAILVFVFPTYWIAGIIMLVTAPLIPVFMAIVGKGAERLNQRQWRKLARMSAHFFDAIEGLTTLKLFNASRAEIAMIAEVSDEYRLDTMAVLRVAFLSSLVLEFFATISVAMVAVYVGFALYYKELAFLQGFFVLLLAPEFYRPLRNMGAQYHARMDAIGASEQIVQILETPLQTQTLPTATIAPSVTAQIRFEAVGFAYQPGESVLDNIDFQIEAGRHIALVGPSGAGKTTISQLLLGFLRPDTGRILIDGIDLATIPPTAWLQRIAWVPQRPTLFHGTVIDNIRLGLDADEAAVHHAAQRANADDFIGRLPLGYQTTLGDRGQGLSGGEIQRIALARAFLKNAPLIVLDEANASLDPATAALITQAIARLAHGRTLFTIAHRLETVQNADLILVIEHGRIIEAGTDAQLQRDNALYTAMRALYQGVEA